MKLIIKDGVSSKNSPKNTMDSINLALKTKCIEGISITVRLTQDGTIIVYSDSIIMCNNINKIPYKELLKYNVGTKIRKNRILTLEEVLENCLRLSKKIVIKLVNCDNNLLLVESLIELVNRYSTENIYLKTDVKEIIIYLKELANPCKIGAIINNYDNYFWDLDLDFYEINCSKVNMSLISKKFSNKTIMFEKIDIKDYFKHARNNFDNSYLVIDNLNEIVKLNSSKM